MALIERYNKNPILSADYKSSFENHSVFNGCPIQDKEKIKLVYRAIAADQEIQGKKLNVSSIGYAESSDGISFKKRKQLISPKEEWECFGCEDPRITKINGKYFIFYTALSKYPFCAEGIKVGVAVTKDFKKIEKHPVTCFNSKAMTLFPEKINGKLAALLSVHTDCPPTKTCIAFFDKEEDIWSPEYWSKWYHSLYDHILPIEKGSKHLVEIGAPPIKTKHGWLIIYANIRNYYSGDQKVFGIDATLLDLKDPTKIIGSIEDPLLIPTEDYEINGKVPNVVFPAGALVKNDDLYIYYGAADTSICLAKVSLKNLLKDLLEKRLVSFERYSKNPILEPSSRNAWESKAVFNPAAIYLDQKSHIVYRAMSQDDTSVLGYASSKNGFEIDERLPYPIYTPRESFEQKTRDTDFSGCEDPRITKIDDILYMTYTAFNGKTARVALTSIKVNDFIKQKWDFKRPILISPPDIYNKNCVLFPEKINNKYVFLHRADGKNIWIDFVSDLSFKKEKWLGGRILLEPRKDKWDSEKIGAAAAPIKTENGWLLFYHGVSQTSRHYRVGAVLLDLNDPKKIIARINAPLLEPRMLYEEEGQVKNVVFPCNAILRDDKIFLYYGGADSVVCVASLSFKKLMKAILKEKI